MGTEHVPYELSFYQTKYTVKLNNPPMGTELDYDMDKRIYAVKES